MSERLVRPCFTEEGTLVVNGEGRGTEKAVFTGCKLRTII